MSNGVKALLIMATPVVVIGGGIWILGVKIFAIVISLAIVSWIPVWVWSLIKDALDERDRCRTGPRAEVPTQCQEPWPHPSPLAYDFMEGLGQETQVMPKVPDDRT